MLDINRYIENGTIKREKIALDIKYGILSKEDIQLLIADDRIKASFIGTEYKGKKPKSEWNRQYLEELSFGVVSEGFNADYLWHLYEVKCYVNPTDKKSRKNNQIAKIIASVVAVIIIVVLVLIFTQGKKSNDDSLSNPAETFVTNEP